LKRLNLLLAVTSSEATALGIAMMVELGELETDQEVVRAACPEEVEDEGEIETRYECLSLAGNPPFPAPMCGQNWAISATLAASVSNFSRPTLSVQHGT